MHFLLLNSLRPQIYLQSGNQDVHSGKEDKETSVLHFLVMGACNYQLSIYKMTFQMG